MPIPTSSAPAVRRYLFTQCTAQITADPADTSASLLVCYDNPGTNQPNDIVAVGKVHRQIKVNSMVGSGGAGWLEETYTVHVTIDVFRGGDDSEATYERAVSLSEAVIAIVRADPSLGGNVLVARPIADATDVEFDDGHMGQHATCELEIQCYQRI